MELLLVILAFALLVAGVLGAVLPILPGPPLCFIGLLVLQWSGFAGFSPAFLWGWAGIAAAVTVMDFFLPSLMAKWFGGSRAAAVGSFVGLLVGIFFFAPWGMLFGSFFGAFFGELYHNRANGIRAFKVALGAFLAFIVGSGAKLIAGSMMLFYAVKSLL